jgi:hypothetical protein
MEPTSSDIGNRRIVNAVASQQLQDDDVIAALDDAVLHGVRQLLAEDRTEIHDDDARATDPANRYQTQNPPGTPRYDVGRTLSNRPRPDGAVEYIVEWGERRPEDCPPWDWLRGDSQFMTPIEDDANEEEQEQDSNGPLDDNDSQQENCSE